MPRKNMPNFSLLAFFFLNKSRIPQHYLQLKGRNGICLKKRFWPLNLAQLKTFSRVWGRKEQIDFSTVGASTLMNPVKTISMGRRVEK